MPDYPRWTLPQLMALAERSLSPERLQYLRDMEADHPGPPKALRRGRRASAGVEALRAAEACLRAVKRALRKGQAGRGCAVLALALADALRCAMPLGWLEVPGKGDAGEAAPPPVRLPKGTWKDAPGQGPIPFTA